MRIIGPNCLGVLHPLSNLNASFATTMAQAGQVALLSQSGAICTSILDWAREAHVGFSVFVSVGSMVDVDFADLIDYFGDDTHTLSIILYIESLGDVRKFLSAAPSIGHPPLSQPVHDALAPAGRYRRSHPRDPTRR
jgi:acetyltransferase